MTQAASKASAHVQPARIWRTWRARALHSAVCRLSWASLLCLHLPILARTALGGFDEGVSAVWLGELAFLAATVALFALKLIDVPFLRLPSRRSALIAFLLITAIVHNDAVATTDSHVPATAAVVVIAPLAGHLIWTRRRALLGSIRRLLNVGGVHIPADLRNHYDDRVEVSGRSWRVICARRRPSRAPPRRALTTM